MDQVKAEWAERIEMDSAIPVKKGQSSVATAAKAAKKPNAAH